MNDDKRRWDLIQFLIDRYEFTRYLEIGCAGGKLYRLIRCAHKVGVDVRGGVATFRGTSDEFYAQNREQFDLVFIDGWHQAEQVAKDVENALAALAPGGIIVLHDCNPQTEVRQQHDPTISGGWNGDVWKAWVALRSRPDLDCCCGDFDQGCGVVLRRQNSQPLALPRKMTWPSLVRRRNDWIRLRPWQHLLNWINDPQWS